MQTLEGECLCGAVRYVATGTVNRVSACYCSQCTKQNGGGPFYGVELQGELKILADDAVQWFASSDKAKRAFCSHCGSSLFWRANADPSYFDVSMGTLNQSDQLSLDAHIFVDACPAYLTVETDAPHYTEAEVLAAPD